MSHPRIRFLFAVSLIVAGAAPAFAESGRYATDPDAFVWSQLAREHLSLAHEDAVLPRTSVTRLARGTAPASAAYATDPDRNIYAQLGREHLALSHTDAVLPRTRLGTAIASPHTGMMQSAGGDPDGRIRMMMVREHNVY